MYEYVSSFRQKYFAAVGKTFTENKVCEFWYVQKIHMAAL